MEINNKKTKNEILVSPLEFRHFVLDIPKINPKYQKQAVQFALKSYYPGTEENTEIDYAYKNTKVIGIAVNKERFVSLKDNFKLVSPTLIVLNSYSQGLYITCSKEWYELFLFENGNIISLNTYSANDTSSIIKKINELQEQNKTVTLINNHTDIADFANFLTDNGYNIKTENFDDLQRKLPRKNIYLFQEKKTKSTNKIVFLSSVVLTILLSIVCFITNSTKNKYKQQLAKTKEEYTELKNSISETQTIETATIDNITSVHSLYEILSEITNTSNSFVLLSFTYSNNAFRFEAESTKAIDILEALKESSFLSDLSLIQSLPQDNGKEKFIITGKIK